MGPSCDCDCLCTQSGDYYPLISIRFSIDFFFLSTHESLSEHDVHLQYINSTMATAERCNQQTWHFMACNVMQSFKRVMHNRGPQQNVIYLQVLSEEHQSRPVTFPLNLLKQFDCFVFASADLEGCWSCCLSFFPSCSLMSVMCLCMWRSLQCQLIVMFFFCLFVFQDCCPGLGSTLGKQEGERLHISLASLQITGNCALFSLPLSVFYSKVKQGRVQ